MEQIYLFSLPVKEYQIVEQFLGSTLKDEVMKIMPVQKQTRAGQRTRFKAFVCVGDSDGHCGLGVKCAKEVRPPRAIATALMSASAQPAFRTDLCCPCFALCLPASVMRTAWRKAQADHFWLCN